MTPVKSRTFQWTEAYSVHIAALDEQHQRLIDTVNELDRALQAGLGNRALEAIFQQLIQYATAHFASEELLMQQHLFPGFATHQARHRDFRVRMAEFLEQHRAGKTGVPVSMLLFLHDWLKDHLLKTDKLYSAYLAARGVR